MEDSVNSSSRKPSARMASASAAAPRAVRTTWRGTEKCAQIRQVAARMFLSQGYDGVSVDEIVKAAGGSKTNVYSHFGGKEGLFIAVVEDMCENFLASFNTVDLSALGPEAGLRVLATSLLAILLQDSHIAFQRLIVAESDRFPALARAWFEHGPRASQHVMAAFIEQQQRLARLRPVHAGIAAVQFHALITTDVMHRAMLGDKPGKKEIAELVDAAIALFMHGLAA